MCCITLSYIVIWLIIIVDGVDILILIMVYGRINLSYIVLWPVITVDGIDLLILFMVYAPKAK